MAGRSSDELVSPTPTTPGSPGTVLVFSFAGLKSYIATSYPHPTKEAKEKNPNETRDFAFSKNIPSSLLKCIDASKGHEQASEDPSKTRYYTLKPGYFFMHITCWEPNPPDEQDEDSTTFDDCKEALWLVYTWTDRASHKWCPDKNPLHQTNIHPTLGKYARHLEGGTTLGGNPSHFALGETSETFFLRLSDDNRNWHYRYHGLPQDCDLAIQQSMAASKLYKDEKDPPCPHKLQHFAFGRPRAVTLGKGGGWILHREENSETQQGGRSLPLALRKALEHGRKRNLVINQVVLNPHHSREYVLAFDDGTVYYSFHESFQKDFDKIARQWCGNKIEYKPHADLLTDEDYPDMVVSDDSGAESESESTARRAPSPQPLHSPQEHERRRQARQKQRYSGRRTPPPVMTNGYHISPSRENLPHHERMNSGFTSIPESAGYGQPPQPVGYVQQQPYPQGYGAVPYGAVPYPPPPAGWGSPYPQGAVYAASQGWTAPPVPIYPAAQGRPLPPSQASPHQPQPQQPQQSQIPVLPAPTHRYHFDPYTGERLYAEAATKDDPEPQFSPISSETMRPTEETVRVNRLQRPEEQQQQQQQHQHQHQQPGSRSRIRFWPHSGTKEGKK
ncbi:hypothetical protein B0H66DRAFT_310389 [Apodospora peruviana]|uniref:Uncharacterized protein n=1 Tax=Apodospora peruviana TaxID=516989 RepID=A0AAE0I2L1_9PEZI|nr:hypothetical protein B0H66DRAFT_310389 [Apodospora peruviana]